MKSSLRVRDTSLVLEMPQRRGTVLVLVLVAIAILALGAYTFSEQMISEVEATSMFGRQAETRAFAESGIELVAAVVSGEETRDSDINNNSAQYQAVAMRTAESGRGRGYFSVVAPMEGDLTGTLVRFGLMDESARININAIPGYGLDDTAARNLLMYLPGMTEDVADAILDWVDDDDTPRTYGAESEYYESLDPPVYAKNGPLTALDELLQVAGVTPELLYGEDANRNGLLDANENDGETSLPYDDADGVLNPGWAAFLTVQAKEVNKRADGSARLFVNDGVLTDLYDKLIEEFDDEAIAQYVVAMRLSGPKLTPEEEAEMQQSGETSGSSLASSGGSTTGDSASTTSGTTGSSGSTAGAPSGGSGTNTTSTASALTTLANNVGQALGGAPPGSVTRGGMDLTGGAKYEIKSLYDLIGSQVEVQINGQATLLESPWSADAASMSDYIPVLFDVLTVVEGAEIPGRINVNQVRLETLLGLPNMTQEMAEAIVAGSPSMATGATAVDPALITTGAWLVTQGIVDVKTMSRLDRYVTGRGNVFRAQVVGYFEEGGGHTRLEAVIDATQSPARILSVTDLSELGRGYRQSVLTGTSGGAP